jgi:hypothetical protein
MAVDLSKSMTGCFIETRIFGFRKYPLWGRKEKILLPDEDFVSRIPSLAD